MQATVRDGFDEFAARELPALLRHAVLLTGDRELAADLVQDVMLRAHAKWRLVVAADSPRAYVRAMVTKAYLSWRRRPAQRTAHILLTDDVTGATGDHAEHVVEQDRLWHSLAGLPPKQRAVLVLRFYQQLTDAEIADVLGCAAGTVRGYASRALATLRADLAEHQPNTEGSRP